MVPTQNINIQHCRHNHTVYRNLVSCAHIRPSCSRRRTSVAVAGTASPAPATQYEPITPVRGGLPWIGVLHRTPVDQLFRFIEREFAETGVRCLDLEVFGRHAVYTRHPEDIGAVLRNAKQWTKASQTLKRLDRWLGEGLVSERDAARHAAARDVLAPAFRAQSVKELVPLFADVAQQLAALLQQQAGGTVELEPVMRRATLDVIGRAGFGHEFGAQQMAQQQQQQQQQTDAQQVDVVKLFDDILDTSMLLIMNPPLPDPLVPGFSKYVAAVDALEAVALQLLQERRQQGISPSDRSLLSFMLAAQQAAAGGLVSDKHIRDQLMTFMLAGSDTSATSLAFCVFELARRPQALQAVQQELRQVLGDTPVDKLQPEVFSSLPYLTGCINECLRLYPAAPGLARIPLQDAVFGPHFIPQGLPVVVDFFSCHRHPDFWARPTEWLPERWLPANMKELGPQHPDAFMPFSAGSRSCIGRYFAMLEMQVMLAVLLRQLSFTAVGGEGDGQIATAQSFTLKSMDGLRVVPAAVA